MPLMCPIWSKPELVLGQIWHHVQPECHALHWSWSSWLKCHTDKIYHQLLLICKCDCLMSVTDLCTNEARLSPNQTYREFLPSAQRAKMYCKLFFKNLNVFPCWRQSGPIITQNWQLGLWQRYHWSYIMTSHVHGKCLFPRHFSRTMSNLSNLCTYFCHSKYHNSQIMGYLSEHLTQHWASRDSRL